jgi:hypothetical protein
MLVRAGPGSFIWGGCNKAQKTHFDITAWVALLSKSKLPVPPVEGAAAAVSPPAGPDILSALLDSECQAELAERPALTGSLMRMATVACFVRLSIFERDLQDAGMRER